MKALISGISGQDGSYLAELLLGKGYEVHGIIRRSSAYNLERIDRILDRLHLHFGDLADAASLESIVEDIEPDEVYNLAAQSHVRVSFDAPAYTADIVAVGTLRMLEAVRKHAGFARFYQASSSEMFGSSPPPQNEETSFHPRSPYAAAKTYGFHIAQNYREAYNMYVVNGILFNHESPRRSENFVSRKITLAAARIKAGLQDKLQLGNIEAERDWGHAKDYVEAMWMMMQKEKAEDFVIGTGISHSVRNLLDIAFQRLDLDWTQYVVLDQAHVRPSEVVSLRADWTKAYRKLGWAPTTTFVDMIHEMVDCDSQRLRP